MSAMHPRRLTNADFIAPSKAIHIYRQTVHESVEVHWHEFYELSFILTGQGTHVLNGTAYPLKRGSIFLLTPADFHHVTVDTHTPLVLFDLVFRADTLRDELYSLLFQDMKSYVTDYNEPEAQAAEQDFQRMWTEANSNNIGSEFIIAGTLERILIDLARKCRVTTEVPSCEQATEQHQKLRRSLIYMHHHFREPLTLEEVARQVHLSPNYFSECFHQAYGASFQKYLQELRLQFAMSLLSTAHLPVTDVCYASGFRSLSHFERAFKQKFAHAPGKFVAGKNAHK